MYPVDLPAVDDTDLTSAAEQYISSLESRPHNNEWFISPHTSKVPLRLFNDTFFYNDDSVLIVGGEQTYISTNWNLITS